MTSTIFNNLSTPTGIAFDPSGNLYLSSLVKDSSPFSFENPAITKISSSGQVLGQVFTSAGATAAEGLITPTTLEFSPELGSLLSLGVDGSLLVIDPNTLTITGGFNLRNLTIDTSSIYDIASNSVSNFGGLIQTQFASYGDFDVRVAGDKTQLFITGLSQAQAFPFVLRLEFQNGAGLTEAKVLFSSRADSLSSGRQTPRLTRGIAVNSQGVVITTLPVSTSSSPIDVPVAFSADFNAQDGLSPGEGPLVFAGTDVYSQGLTTDNAGNFYITTNSVGSASLRVSGEGALVVISSDLNRVISTQSLGSVSSSFRDVAVNPVSNIPFVTVSTFSVFPVPEDLLVSFSPVTTAAIAPSSMASSATTSYGEFSVQKTTLEDVVLDSTPVFQLVSRIFRALDLRFLKPLHRAVRFLSSEPPRIKIGRAHV